MKAVIMAAGKSTRTYPLTLTRPKPLLPVANRPIIEHQLEALPEVVESVVLVVGYRHEMIRERLGDRFGRLAIEYVMQEEQKGTGHAILQCARVIDGPFLAMNGDDLFDPADLARLAATVDSALVKEVEDPQLYGIYEVTEGDRVVRLVEKPVEVFSHLANVGAYHFSPSIFDMLRSTAPSERGEIEITSAIQMLADRGVFRVVEMEGYWLPIGYPWHLLDANAYFLENFLEPLRHGQVSEKAHLSGPVAVGAGSVIKPGVVIEGPVLIGDHCTIGPNCYLRPGTSIGNHGKVGQGSEIKNAIFMERAAAPHQNYVGDSVLGEQVNFGCGTVTANFRHDGRNHRSMVGGVLLDTGRRKLGAIVGDGVHTGIHTCIYGGRKLWPHTTTRPGAVIQRDLME